MTMKVMNDRSSEIAKFMWTGTSPGPRRKFKQKGRLTPKVVATTVNLASVDLKPELKESYLLLWSVISVVHCKCLHIVDRRP